METYHSADEYIRALSLRAGLPLGFRVSTATVEFIPREIPAKTPYALNLGFINLESESDSFAAVFTRNSLPGAPVIIGRKRLQEHLTRGVLVNNKISNVCAESGVEDAEHILRALAGQTGGAAAHYFCASTGIIGWKLPVREITETLPALVAGLDNSSLLPLARAIMTTDAYPKIREARVGGGKITGIAKGAGMIEPNMATMLVFLLTDIDIERPALQQALETACAESFNRISVDGDQSTSDMALIMSSKQVPLADPAEFSRALSEVCRGLAHDIVRNGEGVSHVIRVTVKNAPDTETAAAVGKAVCNSSLVKTAIFGNDPNVGRIMSAIGDYAGNNGIAVDPHRLVVTMGPETIFARGCFRLDEHKEKALSRYLTACAFSNSGGYPPHDRVVEMNVDLEAGTASAAVMGADLSYDYIRENASYRS
jgi:glutamate N-acetyltransferase/amino-acid N-acetyltransferase